jgi:hypothetical protein
LASSWDSTSFTSKWETSTPTPTRHLHQDDGCLQLWHDLLLGTHGT